ncbi:MAG: murein hydrolase activator EnvC family protein [Bacteroidota bacterium]
MRRTFLHILLIVLTAFTSHSLATQDEIKKKRSELENLRDQIREFETKIKEQQKNEKATLELLDTYDRKATALRRLISRLKAEEKKLQKDIEETRDEIGKLGDQLSFLKQHYAQYVSSVYKSGKVHDVELLLTSKSINQFYIRTEYLKRFTDQRQKDAQKISSKKEEIETRQARLQQQLSEERRLIAEKGAEEDRLVTLAAERKDVLFQIRKDKKSVQREIDRKLKAARQLENMIADLIEADRIKKEKEAKSRDGKLAQPPVSAGSFESKKGRLRWPVSEGGVVAKFGNHKHPTLKTITQNTGIDIAVKTGSSVSVVAEGEITTIWWLPGYGNLVIVDHYHGYRTVYAHLSEIQVAEGQRVKEGDVIGTSGEALEGPRLHFELWKDRDKQNPELWLSRQ